MNVYWACCCQSGLCGQFLIPITENLEPTCEKKVFPSFSFGVTRGFFTCQLCRYDPRRSLFRRTWSWATNGLLPLSQMFVVICIILVYSLDFLFASKLTICLTLLGMSRTTDFDKLHRSDHLCSLSKRIVLVMRVNFSEWFRWKMMICRSTKNLSSLRARNEKKQSMRWSTRFLIRCID